MKTLHRSFLFTLIGTQLLFADNTVTSDFKMIKQQNSISLYERWIKHNGNEVRELKAEFEIRSTSIQSILSLLKNGSRGTEWNNNSKTYQVSLTKEEHVWITYICYGIPWPMDDQDCCLRYSYEPAALTASSFAISFESTNYPAFPVKKDVTRITGTKGKWSIENTGNGNFKIAYQVATDKSSSIPRWISDPLVYNNLLKTIASFRSILENKN